MDHVNYKGNMMDEKEKKNEIRLCVDCFHCKTKNKEIYCKLGLWKEIDNGKSILHTPYDFNCTEWDG